MCIRDSLIGEGGGAGGGYQTSGTAPYAPGTTEDSLHSGGCGGAAGGSNSGSGESAPGTQTTNHPIPLTPAILPENSPGSFGNNAGILTPGGYDNAGSEGACGGGGGIGGAGEPTGTDTGGDGGVGLNYNVLDGTTSVGFGGGGLGGGQTDGGTNAVPLVVVIEIHNTTDNPIGFLAYLAVLIEVVVVLVLEIHTIQVLLVVR